MNKHELKSLLENIYTALTEADVPQSSPMELELGLRFDQTIRDLRDRQREWDIPPVVVPPKPTPQHHWEWDGYNLRYWLFPYTPSGQTHGWGQK